MFKSLFDRTGKVELERATQQLLALETTKKRLEIERDQIHLELTNLKTRAQMSTEVETHKVKLELESQKAMFNREKEIWEKEKKEIIERSKREQTEYIEKLKSEHDIKLMEAVTLAKLESQQSVAQTKLDCSREIEELKSKHAEAISDIKVTEADRFYTKLKDEFADMQKNGDKNSQFIQELALKILDKTPTSRNVVDVTVETPKQIVG